MDSIVSFYMQLDCIAIFLCCKNIARLFVPQRQVSVAQIILELIYVSITITFSMCVMASSVEIKLYRYRVDNLAITNYRYPITISS